VDEPIPQPLVFSIRDLRDEEIGNLQYILSHPSYTRVFEPYLRRMRESANHLWLDRRQQRKDTYPDDFLAGQISAIDGLLGFFQKLIDETSVEHAGRAAAELTEEQKYDELRRTGQIRGAGMGPLEKPVAEFSPDEDF
jgi:hypothetical protein